MALPMPTLADLAPLAPEIFVCGAAFALLMVDLFLSDQRRGLTHFLGLAILAGAAVLSARDMSIAPVYGFSDLFVRDLAGVRATGLPVWCQGAAAPPSVAGLTFVNWNEPIGCGGVAVFPDDWVVVDDDGAVLVPAAMIEEICTTAPEQERLEGWIMSEVDKGASLPGLYPPNAENKARYEKSKS
jgi:hypothetical protein